MNLCVANGHVEAFHYPLGLVMDESHFIQERINGQTITETELLRQAVAGLFIKGSRGQFSKLTKRLNVEAKLRDFVFGETSGVLTSAQKEGPKLKKTLGTARLPKGVPLGPGAEQG